MLDAKDGNEKTPLQRACETTLSCDEPQQGNVELFLQEETISLMARKLGTDDLANIQQQKKGKPGKLPELMLALLLSSKATPQDLQKVIGTGVNINMRIPHHAGMHKLTPLHLLVCRTLEGCDNLKGAADLEEGLDMLKKIIGAGADISLKTAQGQTAGEYAVVTLNKMHAQVTAHEDAFEQMTRMLSKKKFYQEMLEILGVESSHFPAWFFPSGRLKGKGKAQNQEPFTHEDVVSWREEEEQACKETGKPLTIGQGKGKGKRLASETEAQEEEESGKRQKEEAPKPSSAPQEEDE